MKHSLRIAFAGTPEFAQTALAAIVQAGFSVPIVLTQPDRPAGRGLKLQTSAVKQWALAHDLKVFQPISLNQRGHYADEAKRALEYLASVEFDVMVVAAYGLLLPAEVLAMPRFGCINIHASLLPRWRGAAPIHRAIEAGDLQTGITIMQMDEGLDSGDMIKTQAVSIEPEDTTVSLHDKLKEIGAHLIVKTLFDLEKNSVLVRQPQPTQGVTYAKKITRQESKINWADKAEEIELKVRAFYGFPVAFTKYEDHLLKIWAGYVEVIDALEPVAPGTIVRIESDHVAVMCGNGKLFCITEFQKAGGRRLRLNETQTASFFEVGKKLL